MPNISFSNTPPLLTTWSVAPSPVGPLMIGLTAQGRVCRIAFLGKRAPAAALKQWQAEWPLTVFEKGRKPAPKLSRQTPVLLVGSDFQHRVWSALLDIPAGEAVTYGELARRIGKPKAARAVGTALGANPVPFLVPCHRVVASNGLGGFTGGLALKKRLLAHEGHCA